MNKYWTTTSTATIPIWTSSTSYEKTTVKYIIKKNK